MKIKKPYFVICTIRRWVPVEDETIENDKI